MDNSINRYDIAGLAGELELELSDLVDLFAGYISEMKEEVSEMRKFLNQNDFEMLQRVVHNIKGVSANLNIKDVFKEAEKFDILLKNSMTEDACAHVNMLASLIEGAEVKIRSFFMENGYNI